MGASVDREPLPCTRPCAGPWGIRQDARAAQSQVRLRDLGAGSFGWKWNKRAERGEARWRHQQGTDQGGFKSQMKDTELYLEAQEQLERDLSRGRTEWDLCFTSSIRKAKGKMGASRTRPKLEYQVGGWLCIQGRVWREGQIEGRIIKSLADSI